MIHDINSSCELLKLGGVLQCYQAIADECSKLQATYSEFLDQVLKYELRQRDQRAQEMMLKMAGFPVLKKLEIFDFSNSNVNQMQIKELATLGFIPNHDNIILIESPRTDKIHLAISLAFLATQKRLKIKFLTISDLMLQMAVAQSQNRLKIYFTKVATHPSLLLLDEFGYVKLNEHQSKFYVSAN